MPASSKAAGYECGKSVAAYDKVVAWGLHLSCAELKAQYGLSMVRER
jgi:hypothetical protein